MHSLSAHHFKGLPHYNYFENYPQVPEEEFIGQIGEYEISLVIYDFQGIDRENVEDPDKVRFFLVIFNLLNSRVYGGALTLQLLDDEEVVYQERYKSSELENLYSMHQDVPPGGDYALRIILHDENDIQCVIQFELSSQRIHWGKWIAVGLFIMIFVTAVGARRARIKMDRREEAKNRKK